MSEGNGENLSSERANGAGKRFRAGTAARIARITVLMAGIFAFFLWLPDLAPERPETLLRKVTGDPSPELCDVESLGFIRVNANRSPLVMRLVPSGPAKAGEEVTVTIALQRPGGVPVTFNDLAIIHERKFHLLIIDPGLRDYHHEHPEPGVVPGEYTVSFTPKYGGVYRFFADLVPLATARPVQAVADLEVAGHEEAPVESRSVETTVDDFTFRFVKPPEKLRAGKAALVRLETRDAVGDDPVKLEPIMGAYAHMVAFDSERSGFAHMHPVREGTGFELDPLAPGLDFIFYADEPGRYAVWAQVQIAGRERFAPFVIEIR